MDFGRNDKRKGPPLVTLAAQGFPLQYTFSQPKGPPCTSGEKNTKFSLTRQVLDSEYVILPTLAEAYLVDLTVDGDGLGPEQKATRGA